MTENERLVKELNSEKAEKNTPIENLETQLRTQKKKILEGEAQHLLENGRTKLFHSGFTPHNGKELLHGLLRWPTLQLWGWIVL